MPVHRFHFFHAENPENACVLFLDPDLVTGPKATPLEKAETLLSGINTIHPYSTNLSYVYHALTAPHALRVGAFDYPYKSFVFLSVLDTKRRFPKAVIHDRPIADLSFFTNSVVRSPVDRLTAWDSVALGVIFGALRVSGPLPYTFHRDLPMPLLFIASACAKVLRPWIGSGHIPHNGTNARLFSKNANPEETANGLCTLLRQNNLHASLREGPLAPNTHHSATHLVKGPFFEDAVGRFPWELIDAGEKIWPLVPTSFWTQKGEEMLKRDTKNTLSAHERLSMYASYQEIDAALVELAPSFARTKRKKGK